MCKYCEVKEHIDEDGYLEYWGGDMFGDGDGYIYKNRIIVYYDGGSGSTGVDNIKYCPFCGRKLTEEKQI